MRFSELRNELYDFYLHGDAERSRAFAEHCFKILNSRFRDGMSVTEQKLLQYDVITEEFEPRIFRHSPYFWETGVLTSLSDGARKAKNHGFLQADGWVHGATSIFSRSRTRSFTPADALRARSCFILSAVLTTTGPSITISTTAHFLKVA